MPLLPLTVTDNDGLLLPVGTAGTAADSCGCCASFDSALTLVFPLCCSVAAWAAAVRCASDWACMKGEVGLEAADEGVEEGVEVAEESDVSAKFCVVGG